MRPGGGAETLGLIAGNRSLPFLWARRAREAGYRVAALGFREETDPRLAREVDAFELVSLGELGRLLRFFKSHGVRRVAMQGQVGHAQLYAGIRTDWRAKWLLARHALRGRDLRTESILKALAEELGSQGLRLQPATWLMEPWLAAKGRLAGPRPGAALRRDAEFGVRLARRLNRLDLGQTLAVKRRSCVAVESLEGTDACILRAGRLAGPACTVVKLARPGQDLRFDLPVVGPATFKALARARAAALVLEAGKTLLLDKERCLELARQAKLAVTAV